MAHVKHIVSTYPVAIAHVVVIVAWVGYIAVYVATG